MKKDSNYKRYAEWKGWGTDVVDSNFLARIEAGFLKLMQQAGVSSEASLLEIGFGNCYFLDWARKRGNTIIGIEIIQALVDEAINKGHTAMHGTLEEHGSKLDKNFDAIVALDVFEHMDLTQLQTSLTIASSCLKPGGSIIIRVPNGGSPFGLMLQNGDSTHMTTFTESKMRQICLDSDFELEWAGNPPRVFSGAKSVLKRCLAYGLRDIFEYVFGMAYFGMRKPMDPSIVFILRHKA